MKIDKDKWTEIQETFIYNKLGIPKNLCTTSFERGIYFSPLFKNTNEFLRKEIDEGKLERRFDNSFEPLKYTMSLPPYIIQVIEERLDYEEWSKRGIPTYIDTEELKKEVIEELQFLNNLDSREYLLYRKHLEIREIDNEEFEYTC